MDISTLIPSALVQEMIAQKKSLIVRGNQVCLADDVLTLDEIKKLSEVVWGDKDGETNSTARDVL